MGKASKQTPDASDSESPTAPSLVGRPLFLSLVTSEPAGEGALVRVEAAWGARHGAKTFESFANTLHLTLAQCRTLGVTNKRLDSAPDLDTVLEDLLEFAAGAEAWIVPDGAAARTAMRGAASSAGLPGRLGPQIAGVDELAAVVLPTVMVRGLSDLEHHCGVAADAPETACSRLERLWSRLEHDLLRLPLPLLAEMNWLLSKSEHPLKTILKKAEGLAVSDKFSESFTAGKLSLDSLFKDFAKIVAYLQADGAEGAPAEAPAEPVTAREVADLLGPNGPLAKALDGYEERPEQVAMAERTAEALSAGKHLLVEAGTGVGKSLAYLVPAILFAKRAARPVMISTHTKNLQAQLFGKDLPFLRLHAGVEFEAALLKGRPNYLCPRKFVYLLQEAAHELDDEERGRLLPIMTWAMQTETGDVGELAAYSPEQSYELWDRLHTTGEDCLRRNCPFYQRCFVYKARGLARAADVVVLNHALVFAELNLEAGTLPPYSEIVFDEAHKLEDVATDHLATEITPRRVQRVLNRLFRVSHGSSAGKGLLPTLLANVEQARGDFPKPLLESIREHILQAMQAIAPGNEGTDCFFSVLREWTERPVVPDDENPAPYVPRERGRGGVVMVPDGDQGAAPFAPPARPFRRRPGAPEGESRKRFSGGSLRPDEAETFKQGKEAAIARLSLLRQALDRLDEDLKEIKKRPVARARELAVDISAQNAFLQELIQDIEFIVRGDEPNYVYWCELLGRRSVRAVAAPLDVSGLLHDQLYERKRSIILTSATLSVRDPDAEAGSGFAPLPPLLRARDAAHGAPAALHAKAHDAGLPAPEKPHPKSFEFLKNRLGLSLCAAGKLDELLLGSPFDYARQCRLFIPAFLPDPGARDRDFNAALTAMLAELIVAAGGRTMVLFTSYAALDASARSLRRLLASEGIEVVAQGADGSRESLLARLQAGGRTALLGTASFWEGVDVRGAALSLLVIAKLPFAVFTEPVIQGRCELLEASGKDPFLHFSVPNAILRLRQGFGRLIRSKTDRGVVVLADKRVLTKRYGAAFLRALPAQAATMTSQEALAAAVREFLG
jgi:Rad3-related DNA helicase